MRVLIALIVVSVVLGLSLVALGLQVSATRRARSQAEAAHAALQRIAPAAETPRRSVRAVKAVAGAAVEGASRLREGGVAGLLTSSLEDLTRWAVEDRGAIARIAGPDGTVTVLFSDIEDSTALNEQLGDEAWVRLLRAHDGLVDQAVGSWRGHIVKSQGDGFMIVFSHTADAVRAGIEIQDALSERPPKSLRRTPIRVRVGIHVGTAVAKDGDFFGRNVAKAARVAAQARGGEILVSDEVRQRLREVEDIVLVDVRETELKGLPGVHRLWEVGVL